MHEKKTAKKSCLKVVDKTGVTLRRQNRILSVPEQNFLRREVWETRSNSSQCSGSDVSPWVQLLMNWCNVRAHPLRPHVLKPELYCACDCTLLFLTICVKTHSRDLLELNWLLCTALNQLQRATTRRFIILKMYSTEFHNSAGVERTTRIAAAAVYVTMTTAIELN